MKNKKRIEFTPHAEEKLNRLTKLNVTKEKIIKTIRTPETLTVGYFGRKIAQSKLTQELVLRVIYELTQELVLRVIYEETDNSFLIITLYPAKKERYI